MNQKLKRKHLLQKSAAIGMAALLGVTAAPVSAFAESSYNEIEQAALTEFINGFIKNYSKGFTNYDAILNGIHEDVTFTLDDAGRSLLGFLIPVDISWFKDLRLSLDGSGTSADGSATFMNGGLYLNDTKLLSLEYTFDYETMDIYFRFPELNEGCIKLDYDDALAAEQEALAGSEELPSEELPSEEDTLSEDPVVDVEIGFSDTYSPEFWNTYTTVMTDIPSFMPEASVVEDLLNKYGSILFNHTTEVPGSTESYTLGSITQDRTVYEAQLTEAETSAYLQEILETAKTDEQLKDLLNSWDEKLPDVENLYDSFLEGVDDALSEFMPVADDGSSFISSKIWVDEEGKTTGRLLSISDSGDTIPFLEWQMLENGENFEYLLQFGPAEEGIILSGNGTITNGLLNGTYDLLLESVPYITIGVTDYDTSAAETGSYNGSYKFTFDAAIMENPDLNMLQNFALLMNLSTSKDSGNIDFSIASADAVLGTISISAGLGTPVEAPDFTGCTMYDAMDEASMNEYAAGITLDTLFENVISAGVPEDVLIALFVGDTMEESTDEPMETEIDPAA